MSRIVQIQYTLAPQLQAKQWVKDELRLAQALKPAKKVLKAEISAAVWSKYQHLPWQDNDGVSTLRTDAVPVRAVLKGCVDVTINPMHRVSIAFKMDDTSRLWRASKVYTDPAELLEALRAQTINDFAEKSVQDQLCTKLGKLLSSLYAEWELPNLEEKFSDYASKLGKLVHDYHVQWSQLEWVVRESDGEALPTGGYLWQNSSPLHHEVLRLLYYITQSFSFIDKHSGSLWVSPATSMASTLNLGFLNTRVHTADVEPEAKAKRKARKAHNPGDADQAKENFAAIKAYLVDTKQDPLTEDVSKIILNVATLIDYLPRVVADTDIEWSPGCVYNLLMDSEYRSDLIKLIPENSLGHKSALDESIQFWEQGGYVMLGMGVKKLTAQALRIIRDYFVWVEAKELGLGLPAIPVYKDSDVLTARRRFQGADVIKKIEPLLYTLEERGPLKYSVLAPAADALNDVAARFPNFKEIVAEIQKQLRLARLQPDAVIKLHPLLIVGDPGWGKTRFLKAMSDALRLPFNEIPMSSVTAGFVLSGGDLMWHAAKQGRIADIFMHGVCINPMIVLDELDKVSGDKHDPYGPLYQLLETHTAKRFMDEALNVPLATQFISWCATANDVSTIPEPILNRFDVFEVPALTPEETPIVAQSIFDDILADNLWGPAFDPVLPIDFARKLHGMNARSMYFALRNACGNASERTELPLVLQVSDLQEKSSRKLSMGFTS